MTIVSPSKWPRTQSPYYK
ncbi:unnamed protein product [Larinioides sclopetarius]|uniref:Uncharacterized protein n=1 Tax=Larinioides sclopetarius TaxID=280406 RepID=A0AAV1YRK1_9ARAC